MKLFDAAWAPNPRRVRIFLAEKGVDLPREQIDLRRNEQLEPAYLARVPRGLVPALELDSGEVITESTAICRYVEALHPTPALFGADPLEIARVESWNRRIENDGYAAAVYAFRNAHPAFADRALPGRWPAVAQVPALAERGQVMWAAFIAALDEQLATSEWVAGERYSFADITALTTIDFAKAAKLPVPDGAAHVRRWHQAAGARPSADA